VFILFLKTILIYTIVLIAMRLMGKREIGQIQPFELAITIMIADLATIPIAEKDVSMVNGIIPIISLLIMHLLLSFINLKSIRAREIICGKPSILVFRGKIDEKVLRKERITIHELEEKLRGANISNLADVEYAILETNGNLSVIQKPNKRNAIPEDFHIIPEYEGLPYDLVVDGKILHDNLNKVNKTEEWLRFELGKLKLKPENALVVTLDGKGQIFSQKKEKNK